MTQDVSAGPRHQLGGYREYHPPAALAAVAESAWTHQATTEDTPASGGMHRVLPDPSFNLAFRCRRTPDGTVVDPRLVVIGPKTRPLLFRFHPGDEIAAVRVKLEWAKYLLDLAPADHLDREDELADAIPRLAGPLTATLAATRSLEAAAALLVAAVLQALHRARTPGPAAPARALDLVRRVGGRLTIEAVAGRIGVSERQLRRTVRDESAFSLKTYARITRLNHAMALADRLVGPPWARIAAEAGFCDQSHLVRECRALAGLAPGQVHRERRAQADLSNRD